MEEMILCSLDHSQVYANKDFCLLLTIKNGTGKEWIVGQTSPVCVEIPVGREPDDLVGVAEDVTVETDDMQVEKETDQEIWKIYGEDPEAKICADGEIHIRIRGKDPWFPKLQASYMSGIRVYGTAQGETFCEYLPIYKAEDQLDILYFRAEGKKEDVKGCIEADLGEELVLEWDSVGAQNCYLWPGGLIKEGQTVQKVTVWQDTMYTLLVWDKSGYVKKELSVVIRAPTCRRIEKITADTSEKRAEILFDYENASFSYVDRGVGRVGNSIHMQDYDGGEYYFVFFPGNRKASGSFQLEEKDGLRLEKLSYYYKQESGKNVYYFRWRVSGSQGKVWIEKNGQRQEEKEWGEISFASSSDETIVLTMGALDEAGKEHVFYDIWPFRL